MVSYRKFSLTDQSTVLQFMSDFYAIDGYPFNWEKATKLYAQLVNQPELGQGYIVENHGKPAGYIVLSYFFSFEFGGRMALLDELYIDASFRGHGLGKAALAHAQNVMNELEIVGYYLEVEPHNEVAKKLYLAQGFTQHERQFLRFTPLYNTK